MAPTPRETLREHAAELPRNGGASLTPQSYLRSLEELRCWSPVVVMDSIPAGIRQARRKSIFSASGIPWRSDLVQYARHGVEVVCACSSAEQLALIRRNFELRGLQGSFLHAAPAVLPLESSSIDVGLPLSGLELRNPRLPPSCWMKSIASSNPAARCWPWCRHVTTSFSGRAGGVWENAWLGRKAPMDQL